MASNNAASEAIVTGKCQKCKKIIGQFENSWKQVTGTYFLQANQGDGVKHILKPKGATSRPHHDALANCLLQPLACTCGETVAFHCSTVSGSDKQAYRGRDFFKLKKIDFTSRWSGEALEPVIEASLSAERRPFRGASQSSSCETPSQPKSKQKAPAATEIDDAVFSRLVADVAAANPQLAMPVFAAADRAAVAGTNDGSLDWREAHENWTRATDVTLSPMAFGRRILDMGGGKRVKVVQVSAGTRQSMTSQTQQSPPLPAPAGNPRPISVSSVSPSVSPTVIGARSREANATSRRTSGASTLQGPGQLNRPISAGLRTSGRPSPLQYSASFSPELTTPTQPPPSTRPSFDVPQATTITSPTVGNSAQPTSSDAPPSSVPGVATDVATPNAHSGAQSQAAHQQIPASANSPWFQPSHAISFVPASPGATVTMEKYQCDMDTIKTQFLQIQTTLTGLNARVDDLASRQFSSNIKRGDQIEQARNQAKDALAEKVSNVSAETKHFDNIATQLELLNQKVKNLEDSDRNVATTSGSPQDHSMRPDQSRGTLASQNLESDGSRTFTTANGVKRSGQSDLDDRISTRMSDRSGLDHFPSPSSVRSIEQTHTSQSLGPHTDWEAQTPTLSVRGGYYQSLPRKRGRPSKSDLLLRELEAEAEHEHFRRTKDPDMLEDAIFGTPATLYSPAAGGSLIRRGIGGEAPKRRTKPIRNVEGLLLRADGSIDKRSFTSKHNLLKASQTKLAQSNMESKAEAAVPDHAGLSPSERLIGIASTYPARQEYEYNKPPKRPDHNKIMKQMFPNGISAETHRLNHAEQLFSNGSPERPRMLQRDEMRREDAASDPTAIASLNGLAKATGQSSSSVTRKGQNYLNASDWPSPPRSDASDNSGSPEYMDAMNDETDSDIVPDSAQSVQTSLDVTARLVNRSIAKKRFSIPDSESSVSKASSVGVVATPGTVVTGHDEHESQQSYKPSQWTMA